MSGPNSTQEGQGTDVAGDAHRPAADRTARNRALLADAEDLAGTGSWEYLPATGRLSWSPGMYRLHGRPPGPSTVSLALATRDVHPDDRERVAREYAGARPGATHRVVRGDGSVVHVQTRARSERTGDAATTRIVGACVDVTELVRARAKLAAAEAVAGFGTAEFDIARGTVDWSDALCRIYGVAPGEPRSLDDLLTFVHPDDRRRVEAAVRRASESLQRYSIEYRIVRPDGAVRVLRARGEVTVDGLGRPVCLLGTAQDVTEATAVEAARARLAALVDFSDDAIVGISPAGVIESWNPGAGELYGYTADEAVGQSIAMLVPSDRAGEMSWLLARIKRGERTVEPLETVRVTKDGSLVDVSLRVSLVHDADGQVVGVSAIARRITEQKALEAELRSSSRHFDLSRDLTVTAGLDGYFKSVNPVVEHILGWTAEEFLSRPFIDMVHPDDRPATEREFARLVDGQVTFNFVNRYQTSDGGYRWLDWNATLAPEEALLYCAARDVTDRRAVDAALAASERQTRQILETAHDAFVAIDADGLITEWNPRAHAMFGWTAAEVRGRELAETIVPPTQRDAHRRGLASFTAGGRSELVGRLVELSAVHRDGHEFPVELTISPMATDRGYAFSAFLRDITDRRRTQEELRLARDEALDASNMKSIFVANVSHEIRTPMNGVIGMTELLLETALTGEQREYAEMISASGESLLEVIDDILDFSKIEAGKLELDATDFDVRDAIEKVSSMQATRAHRKGVELIVAIDPDLPSRLHGDVARLRQVIANLVSNAIKFTTSGEVVVRARAKTTDAGATRLRVDVSDTGIGIAADALARLFMPFTQASGSTTRKYGGTGLGLAISKQLIELMGGTIGAHSDPGHGSTFWFELTLAASPAAAANGVPPSDAIAGMKVLVVDDNATNRLILEQQLGSMRVACRVADSAATALAMLRAAVPGRPYAVALIDQNMPEVDGYDLARAIRGEPALKDMRLLLLSSSVAGGPATEDPVLFDRTLTKPIRQTRLHEEIVAVTAARTAPARPGPDVAAARRATTAEVLVVEDTPVNQTVAMRMLAGCGYAAAVVNDGREALAALDRRPYAAVLMDCHMPELDGYETTRLIRRSDRSWRGVPVIAMTANSMRGERERCLAAGMDDYLSKPLRSQALSDTLSRWVPAATTTSTPTPVPVAAPTPTMTPLTAPAQARAPAPRPAGPRDAEGDDGLLDEATIADLAFIGETVTELHEMFFAGSAAQVSELDAAIRDGQAATVARVAHKLKGSGAAIGAARVARLAGALEAAGRADDLTAAGDLLDRLRAGLVATRRALTAA